MKRALVLGGAGFIGMALTKRLVDEGYWVRAVDQRHPPFAESVADDFWLGIDLRDNAQVQEIAKSHDYDEVYQFACDMGGAGYIFTGEHDAEVMRNNGRINFNVAEAFSKIGCGRLLYTSSSCVYDDELGNDGAEYLNPLRESDAYPAQPSNGYGWEKLFSEQMYLAHKRNFGLNVAITRFSTIYGPGSAFDDGREKAVAAICRKAIDAQHGGQVEVWGDGTQVRPLVYIDDLLDAVTGLMRCTTHDGPMNIATTEMTTCAEIARQAIAFSNKRLGIKYVDGPIGKRVLKMNTDLAREHLSWTASTPFSVGIERTFEWIARQKAERAAA